MCRFIFCFKTGLYETKLVGTLRVGGEQDLCSLAGALALL